MTVALQATTPASFEIKSANLPLVALLLKSADIEALARDFAVRFGDIPDFFDNDALVIDLAPLKSDADAASTIDFAALLALLRSHRLVPLAARGGNAAEMAAALEAGLLPTPDVQVAAPRAAAAESAPRPATPVQAAPDLSPGALVIDRPLRSGQQIYARGRDLVVMAMVNAGAEVIADGSIHVYAPLRGKAMAGARGNAEARIFALALEAELLSIAGVYRTSENPLPASVQGKPAQVQLVPGDDGSDKLVMTAL